jgi:hypothetical protein
MIIHTRLEKSITNTVLIRMPIAQKAYKQTHELGD